VLSNFQRQYDHYKSEFDAAGGRTLLAIAFGRDMRREITLFNRLVLDVEDAELPAFTVLLMEQESSRLHDMSTFGHNHSNFVASIMELALGMPESRLLAARCLVGGGRGRADDRDRRTDLSRVNSRLAPTLGPRGRTVAERASGSDGPRSVGTEPRGGTRAGGGDSGGASPLQEGHAVDAWRFLLGLDVESFEAGVDVVASGGQLLPEYARAMITETIANYDHNDRMIMTLAFVRFLRMLMAEVMLAFERGVTASAARERDEILVDVRVEEDDDGGDRGDGTSLMQRSLARQFAAHACVEEENDGGGSGDGTSLMQRTLTGQFAAQTNGWTRVLQGLQDELGGQQAPLRNANTAGLMARLNTATDIPQECREPLLALFVGMQDPDCCQTAVGDIGWQVAWWGRVITAMQMVHCQTAVGDIGWQVAWWGRVITAMQMVQTQLVDPETLQDTPTAEELEQMAADEREVRDARARENVERGQQEAKHELEEEEFLAYQVGLLESGHPSAAESCANPLESGTQPARLSAQEFRQWEDWEWHNLMTEPPRQRRRLALVATVSGGPSSSGPWLSRSIRIPCSQNAHGVGVRLDMRFEQEVCPDDVETVVLPGRSAPADGQDGTGSGGDSCEAMHGSQNASSPGCLDHTAGARPLPEVDPRAGMQEVVQPSDQLVQDEAAAQDEALSKVSWDDYESLYDQWKQGLVGEAFVVQVGGLVNSVKPAVTKEYQTFEHSLVYTPNPQMLDQEAWHEGAGCWVQLAISAALQFRDEQGRWPAEADGGSLATMVKAISEEQRSKKLPSSNILLERASMPTCPSPPSCREVLRAVSRRGSPDDPFGGLRWDTL
ncbi:unnamed protein product, partial [Symbiodinium microadriaticum]